MFSIHKLTIVFVCLFVCLFLFYGKSNVTSIINYCRVDILLVILMVVVM